MANLAGSCRFVRISKQFLWSRGQLPTTPTNPGQSASHLRRRQRSEVNAPAAVLSGADVQVGRLFGIANGDAATGKPLVLSTSGVFELPKTTADDIAVGAAVYWNDADNQVTVTSTDNTRIGVAIAAAAAGVTGVKVRLNGAF